MLNHQDILRRAATLPALPPSCLRLAALAAQDDPDLREIEQIVSLDPILTAKVLRLANSAMFGPLRTIGRVRDAVVRTGTQALLGVLVGQSTGPLLKREVPSFGYSGEGLWRHSVAAAIATKALAEKCPQFSSPFSFTSALLHDIGKLVLEPMLTSTMVDLCRKAIAEAGRAAFEAEHEILSLDHAEVSGIVIEHWLLPEIIVNAVKSHHSPDNNGDPIILVVYMADVVAKEIVGRPPTPSQLEPFNAIRERLGITPGEFVQICQTTIERINQVGALYG